MVSRAPEKTTIQSALHFANLSNKCSKHEAFHYITLSNVIFFIDNQICSNVAKCVYKAREGRSPTVAKLRCCLVDILDSMRTNTKTRVQGFWLWVSECCQYLLRVKVCIAHFFWHHFDLYSLQAAGDQKSVSEK